MGMRLFLFFCMKWLVLFKWLNEVRDFGLGIDFLGGGWDEERWKKGSKRKGKDGGFVLGKGVLCGGVFVLMYMLKEWIGRGS